MPGTLLVSCLVYTGLAIEVHIGDYGFGQQLRGSAEQMKIAKLLLTLNPAAMFKPSSSALAQPISCRPSSRGSVNRADVHMETLEDLKSLAMQQNSVIGPASALKRAPGFTRRVAGYGLFLAALASSSQSSFAFDNGAPEMVRYKDEKKCPKDFYSPPDNKKQLGLQGNGKLAICPDTPNCFTTSGDSRKNLLEVWTPQAGGDSMGELLATVKAYPPGQNGACLKPGGPSSCIDGGGFEIVKSTPSYLYVQFESIKSAFIDDVEFAVDASGAVQVRSASRVGKIDFLVNSKRLNWISERLRAKGWTAPAITQKTHPEYFQQLQQR